MQQNQMTRRGFMTVAGLAASTILIGGCASKKDDSYSSSSASEEHDDSGQEEIVEPKGETENVQEEDMQNKKVLVAYFSNTGNTQAVAEKIAAATDAEFFRIEPEVAYTQADLDYNDDDARCMRELNDPSSRPEIANKVSGWGEYDTVFVGYPIWWSRTPPIMETFAESYDWDGKTAIPFCTSGSSAIGQSADVLEEETPGAKWLPGKRFSRSTSESEIASWAKECLGE